jgi:putative transposase
MPSRNVIKKYVDGGVYHVYNRGVDKQKIFKDKQDYKFFLSLMKIYLEKPADNLKGFNPFSIQYRGSAIKQGVFSQRVCLLAFALMPNHYHLLIKVEDGPAITEFMKSVMTIYVMYFNKKYNRVGSLFQGVYKAVLVEGDEYLIHIARYIHLNPIENSKTRAITDKDLDKILDGFNSYTYYVGLNNAAWVKPNFILSYFRDLNDFRNFTQKSSINEKEYLGQRALD